MILADEMHHKLIDAIYRGNLEEVELLLINGVNIHADYEHAVRYATVHDHVEIVKLLIAHGADIHILDDRVLSDACYHGHLEVVKLLVENGADVYNESAMKWAKGRNQLEIINYLNNQKMLDKLKKLI
jgi:ankyrin repeat protein